MSRCAWVPVLAFLLALVPGCGAGGSGAAEPPAINLAGDDDDDGLTGQVEVDGWEIYIDSYGFGQTERRDLLLETRHVTADPGMKDTDGDGLDDLTEWIIRTDPRDPDTDKDELTDYQEWNWFFTSPVSADSDGDATGGGDESPNGFLFDGQELLVGTVKGRTSPTLADTDGDGLTDGEEIDHATRSPVIADFPKIKLEILGEPVIALRVEYSDGTTLEEGISEEETNSTEVSQVSTSSRTQESHIGGSIQVMAGYEQKTGIEGGGLGNTKVSTEVTKKVEVTAGVDWGSSDSTTREFSEGFTRAASRTTARLASESNERTETSASGEVMIRVRIRNVSDAIAFEVTQVGVAVRLWTTPEDPREAPSFRQLAVLTLPPGMAGGVTLSPGAATGELTFQAENVNAAVIKEFLRNPSALTFEPIYFDLSDGAGLNFAFLTENTYTQTAMIEIDNGTDEPRVVRVATNIDRVEPDADGNGGGAFKGVTMGSALEEILGLKRGVDWDVAERDVSIEGVERKVNVLYRLQDKTEGGAPPAPRFVGQATVTAGSREVVLLDGPTPNGEDTSARFVEGWESDWLGRTFVMKDDEDAYVPVALKDLDDPGSDPLQATLILNRPYVGASRTEQYTLDDLFQADACATPIVADTELTEIGGAVRGFWMVLATDGEQLQPTINFEDIILKAGDQVRLTFWEDEDGDGTSGRTEQYFGTANSCLDCDEDGLGDSVEVIRGWIAGAPDVLPIERERFFRVVEALRMGESFPLILDGDIDIQEAEFRRLERKLLLDDARRNYPKWVRSSPTEADADQDSLSDRMECMAGTDPNHPDTDGDGLPDGSDPSPLQPASILHVDRDFQSVADTPAVDSAERGLAWDTAFPTLQDALAAAAHRNNDFLAEPDPISGDPVLDVANDVSFIFVKEGEYAPDEYTPGGLYDQPTIATGLFKASATFVLLPDIVIFGGFAGGEEKLAERPDSPPVTTTLKPSVGAQIAIVTCGGSASRRRVEAGAGLRDLTISGGLALSGAGMTNLGGAPTLLRVSFVGNRAVSTGGAIFDVRGVHQGAAGGVTANAEAEYSQCFFDDNSTVLGGGGAVAASNSSSRFTECTFTNNVSSGGGAIVSSASVDQVLSIDTCEFRQNEASHGGALRVASGNVLVKDCYFWKNTTDPLDVRFATYTSFHHAQWVTGLTATSKYEFDVFYDYDDVYYEDDGAEDAVKVLTFTDGEPLAGKTIDGVTTYPNYERATPTYYDDFVNRMLDGPVQAGTGGAITCGGGHVVTLQCVFDRNEALAGGAIAFFGTAKFDIFNCTFAHNAAIGLAGAVYAPDTTSTGTMRNTLAVGGEADRPVLDQPDDSTAGSAGAYHLFRYADEVGAGNVDEDKSSSAYVDLKNFVKQDPVIPPEIYVQASAYRFLNCLVDTGADGSGAGNASGIDVESDLGINQLSRSGVRVLDLTSTSAAIDSGVATFDFDPFTSGTQALPKDLAGVARDDGRIDIGAYEFEP